jgi:hypothetical protein
MTGDKDSTKSGGSVPRTRSGPRREPAVIELAAESTVVPDAAPPPRETAADAAPATTTAPEMTADATAAPLADPVVNRGADEAPAGDPADRPADAVSEPVALAEPAPETSPDDPPTPPPPRSPVRETPAGRIGLPVVAGFVGGAVAAVLFATAMASFGQGDTTERLAALEAGLGEKATRRAQDAVEKRVAAAEGTSQSLRTEVENLARRVAADTTSTQDRLQRLDAGLAAAASRPAPPAPLPPPAPVQAIGARESALMTVSWLTRDALARGAPFSRELAALTAAGADPALVAALKPFADTGAPTTAALAGRLAPIAEALSRTPDTPSTAGVAERIASGISRLYRVQPLGDAQGDTPAAIVARAEAALRRGALADAVTALSALPASAPADARSFADILRQRLAAAQAADTLVARSVDQVIAATQSAGGTAR